MFKKTADLAEDGSPKLSELSELSVARDELNFDISRLLPLFGLLHHCVQNLNSLKS